MAKIEITHDSGDEAGVELKKSKKLKAKPAKSSTKKINISNSTEPQQTFEPVAIAEDEPDTLVIEQVDPKVPKTIKINIFDEPEVPSSSEAAPVIKEDINVPVVTEAPFPPVVELAKTDEENDVSEAVEIPNSSDANKSIQEETQSSSELVDIEQLDNNEQLDDQQIEQKPEIESNEVPLDQEEPTVEEEVAEDDVDKSVDGAVDDVLLSDSDELLERVDADLEEAFLPQKKVGFAKKLANLLRAWRRNGWLFYSSIIGLLAIMIFLALTPAVRYYVLNHMGVKASASMLVLDDKTQQPLKNAHVTLDGQTISTDLDGKVTFSKLHLGPTELIVNKRAFADLNKHIVIGWGSNPLGQFQISATGTQYKLEVTDWLSAKPIDKVEASNSELNALSDSLGKITLVLDAGAGDNPTVTINKEGYRTEVITVNSNLKTAQQIKLVPDKKHLFVSKRSGKYDIYKVDIDGKNEQKLVAGTGSEQDDMVLVPNPLSNFAATVSTRDNLHNQDGFTLSSLFVIDESNGQLTKLAQSERIQIIDWVGDKLVYVTVAEGASGTNPKRHRLVSYDIKTADKKELAYSNYFNDVLIMAGRIYYAPSNAYQENTNSAKLFSVKPDGSDLQTILNREVWNIFRTDYDELSIAAAQDWYSYKLGSSSASKLAGPPAVTKSKLFVSNSSQSNAVWVDDRDGKGTLLLRDVKIGEDKSILSHVGLKMPVYWLNDKTIVFRITNDQETADYALNIDGGKEVKIKDVSNIGGIDRWYYY